MNSKRTFSLAQFQSKRIFVEHIYRVNRGMGVPIKHYMASLHNGDLRERVNFLRNVIYSR